MLGNRSSQRNSATIAQVHIGRSQFDRSFTAKDTFDFDYLVPCFVDEVLPGDTFNLQMSTFGRLATPIKPVMDNMYIDFFFFFVPNRLVWDNWEKFNGAQDNPGDSTDFLIPQVVSRASTGEAVGSVWDKFGLPTQIPGLSVSALPFRAADLIWNDWFRDENLQNSIVVSKDDGPDLITDYALRKRGKRHDYFTSALPWPQKGPAVELPLGTSAPITTTGNPIRLRGATSGHDGIMNIATASGNPIQANPGGWTNGENIQFGNPVDYMTVDLSAATAATINQLRQAFSIQSLYELDARGGTRYVEILKAHFNVISPDFRLQRPEYLGGGQSKISSHPVAQTAPTGVDTPQGNLAAFATTAGNGIGFAKSFVEHGYVIGFMAARADLTYQQGINKMWLRETRFDFFWPKLQEMGEQAILNKEIYAQGTGHENTDNAVFGYQERYAEYRYMPSLIKGEFRSTFAQSLDVWHLAQEFGTLPALNGTFIESSTPIDRVIAVNTEPDLLMDMWYNYKCARPMLANPTPSTLGKF